MAGILEGVKVVDMGHVVAAPAACAMMADWGADVIKVEPLAGELIRGLRRFQDVDVVIPFEGGEVFPAVELLNRSKRGIALDLQQESGKAIFYELIKASDVFLTNYELSAVKKLNLDYDTIRSHNPTIVYALLTGYGTVGPDKDERGFDYSAAWARSGMQHLIGEPGSPPPPQRGGMMDTVTSTQIVAGCMAALLHKEKTGEGQQLEFSLYHSAVWTLGLDIQMALMDAPLPKHDRTAAKNPLWNTYRTKDDRWIWLSMLQSDQQWPGFCRSIGKPELENDPRFADMEARDLNAKALILILDEAFAGHTLEEWIIRLKENDCIFARVQTPTEVTADPQAAANNFFSEIDHPVGIKMRMINTPVKFRQNPASIKAVAPQIGQHTEEILLDLGFDWEDIIRFKDQGVIL
jgi:crotonobetainyl-CoA:carnitine CoA-transferase CaiB-like acyl-CoA transferase